MKDYMIFLVIGVLVGLGAALPFFDNTFRDFRPPKPAHLVDQQGIFAPAEQKALYVSSSASDWDSTPSDGGGDTNPTLPTLGPGGMPTQPSGNKNPVKLSNAVSVGGVTAGVIVGLALAVGIAVAVAVYIIKKKG